MKYFLGGLHFSPSCALQFGQTPTHQTLLMRISFFTVVAFICLFCPAAYGQLVPTRQLKDFKEAEPYITKFYEKYKDLPPGDNGYIFQLLIGLDGKDGGLRDMIYEPTLHVRVFMGWSEQEAETRTVLWPATAQHEPGYSVVTGIYKIKNNNGCRPYCDFTQLNVKDPANEKKCSHPPTFETPQKEAVEFIQNWTAKGQRDPLTNFYLDRQVILEMNNFRFRADYKAYDFIRIYHGLDEKDRRVLIIIPATGTGKGSHDFVWIQDAGGLCNGPCPDPKKRTPIRRHWLHRLFNH